MSCIKIMVFSKEANLFSCTTVWRKCLLKNLIDFDFGSISQKVQIAHLLITPAHTRVEVALQPQTHTSGPSRVTLFSSIHKKISSDISWPSLDASTSVFCSVVAGFHSSLHWPSLSIEHLGLLGNPGRLQFCCMTTT